jgi:CheY-like chemotaxis protein/anti-sigma regulatory factor (Ser/Thr protein kinase)
VVETSNATGRSAQHALTVDAARVWVSGDAARLDQVLTNLLANALSHTPAGGAIAIELRHERGEAVLSVTDSGAGIDARVLPRVFDLFFQDEQRSDRPRSGLGIGLTLVQRLVLLHSGTVSAASDGPGRGARFTVRLPAVAAPAVAPEAVAPPPPAGRRVLVIDDHQDARESLAIALQLEGHQVEQAGTGAEALRRLETFAADAAVVDIGLPGMDGYTVAREIRARALAPVAAAVANAPASGAATGVLASAPHVPLLIALTGYGLPEDRRRAAEAGFDAHLVKPADFERLLQLIEGAK